MTRSRRTFQVVNNKINFKCHSCNAKRLIAIPVGVMRRSIKCHKCQESTLCILNRRLRPRQAQTGKVVVVTVNYDLIEVMLYDVTDGSVGASFDLPYGNPLTKKIRSGSKIRLNCNWNRYLFGSKYYIVKSIRGQRVGVGIS
ncbi:hypothetical protein SAMN02745220_04568 [Desulfopila aestuarii DSM 18488]|uniref:PilZ domain-containing protein n=1 Tax=Desulfopila aestuarii DSM 18488 TaxID=1121416 RepID=A0A1M7YIK7_9BACT|nr:hypothetical protein SAMN02745220_04568 [Desulfopila aestuarii DSM 18488]